MKPTIIGNATLYNADCMDVLKTLPANSVEACLTDPPYGLSAHSEADIRKCMAAWLDDKPYVHGGAGFMGKSWDSFVPGPEMWRKLFRVLKPGAHLLVFAGTRTADLMSMALRLAGFECRETLMWCFGSGFPKAADIGKGIDKMKGADREVVGYNGNGRPNRAGKLSHSLERPQTEGGNITAPATPESAQWDGWKSALKPAYEPILLFRKPLDDTIAANTLKWGCGGLNVGATRVEGDAWNRSASGDKPSGKTGIYGIRERIEQGAQGRYPANIILSSDEEVERCFPDDCHPRGNVSTGTKKRKGGITYCTEMMRDNAPHLTRKDATTSASRFFQHCDYTIEELAELNGIEPKRIVYSGKASKQDRDEGCEGIGFSDKYGEKGQWNSHDCFSGKSGDEAWKAKHPNLPKHNHHATVKPTALLRYLLKLITPPGATVIDPFLGSGSTAKAALLEGFNVIGIEREPDYFEICKARVAYVSPEAFTVQPTGNTAQRQQTLFTEPESCHV